MIRPGKNHFKVFAFCPLPAVSGRQDRPGKFGRVHAVKIHLMPYGRPDNKAHRPHAGIAVIVILRAARDPIGNRPAFIFPALADRCLEVCRFRV